MRNAMIAAAASLALVACQNTAEAPPAEDNVAVADANAAAATPAALTSVNETTWEWTDAETKALTTLSIDRSGNYIINAGPKHIDHGTAVMKDGKACYTSAMTKDGEMCWTDPMLAEGQSGESTSDKGEKLAVTRTAYKPLSM